jgi:FKBP-type peptidyl-prolyl cis-trans isomerase
MKKNSIHKKTSGRINGILFILILLFFISCNEEPEKKSGEIVSEKEVKENKTNPEDTANNSEILSEEVKDVMELPGGTKISFLKHGKGTEFKKGEMAEINYKTFLPDGKQIDGNEILGKPLSYFIGINMSVKGWDEVFLKLREGDKIKLHLPSEKAYGKKGFGTMVPPDTDLDFEIEVIKRITPITTKSGLKYFYLVKKEDGKPTKEGGKIDIHYYAWLYKTGKLYDSSHNGGKMYRFSVGGGEEIQCWEEMVKIMREGEKILIVVPPKMGFAEKGIPELVPPNSTLVFVMELMKVL